MSKLSRWLFLILALFLLVMLPTKTAFATSGASGSGTGGSSSEGTENLSDGASETKTGYIIYASDSNRYSDSGTISNIKIKDDQFTI